MKANEAESHETIRKALADRYPGFPVVVMGSPDDQLVLCLFVFAVPGEMVGKVKSAIREIGRDMFPGGEYLLLPMIMNLEVTRQHYPEYMPPEPAEPAALTLRRLLAEALKPSEWQPAPLPAFFSADWRTLPENLSLDLERITGGPLQPHRSQEVRVPANEELALAA